MCPDGAAYRAGASKRRAIYAGQVITVTANGSPFAGGGQQQIVRTYNCLMDESS